jgi:hypothetical protein
MANLITIDRAIVVLSGALFIFSSFKVNQKRFNALAKPPADT